MLFLIKHRLNSLLTISKYTQPLIFRRLIITFNKLLIYLCFGQKAGSFQSIFLKLNCYHLGASINVHTYLINGITILPADKVLDLGIITDNDLSYSSHISSIISKARSGTGIIFRSLFSHNISLLRQAYITFVRPINRICLTSLGKLTSRLFVL